MRKVSVVTTGGTIEKTYDERSGELSNRRTLIHRMLGELRLEATAVEVEELMSKDSLDMTDEDRRQIVAAVRRLTPGPATEPGSGLVVLHGTDSLQQTGELLAQELSALAVPVVLTGAWRPFEMKRSDALQNLTEAIFATGVLSPGVYVVVHGRALRFPGVRKDHDRATFVKRVGRVGGD